MNITLKSECVWDLLVLVLVASGKQCWPQRQPRHTAVLCAHLQVFWGTAGYKGGHP